MTTLAAKISTLETLLRFAALQVSAAVFGIALLALIALSHLFWPESAPIDRYDALFIAAVLIQIALLAAKWETWDEAKVIIVFHLVGTVMELFKTAAGAWIYPEESILRIGQVPLFTGFMYSAVGSYIARSWRLYQMTLEGYPRQLYAGLLAAAIYVNFFAHHYVWDWRLLLFAATVLLFGRCWATIHVANRSARFPLLVLFLSVGVLIWVAENIATAANIWLYPSQQNGWTPVSSAKIGSWFLLMIISFVLVSTLHHRTELSDRDDQPGS
ncbi:MAG: DUF817 domain-containing protein [Pseudomonadota bacterium]